ncbi:autotransporter domain-containing protein [Xanthobacter dioxanivorans]|uniref:Autotransporter domain-containing protein n=1 Tax=Xanthobacter dioxanivorans TaxID=2528964 RepID=A0A974SI40_9HYPH|nr:autotransporter outer membrane beta-barrel domain-containing protein [Xanthobacter dioxanivorans]QRG06022.1 autotransporter domain-containing protein [Xanthobacter dioxanivorans]
MTFLHSSVGRFVLTLCCCGLAFPASAGSFNTPPAAGPQQVSGTDQGTIASGSTLDGGASPAIEWNGPATGVLISNLGTITSDESAIASTSAATGTFRVENGGRITSPDDAIRINGTFNSAEDRVTIENRGTISSVNGQAFDAEGAHELGVTIENYGLITSQQSDAIRAGEGAIIQNRGTIEAYANGKSAILIDGTPAGDLFRGSSVYNGFGNQINSSGDAFKVIDAPTSTAVYGISIVNGGVISASGGGNAIDLGELHSPNRYSTSIRNGYSGLIGARDNDAIVGVDGLVITNNGRIYANYNSGSPDTHDVAAIEIDGGTVGRPATITVINVREDGDTIPEISAIISGANDGIRALGADDTVIVENRGLIRGLNGAGIRSNGNAVVVNYENIQGHNDAGVSARNATITNRSNITGRTDPGAAAGDGDGVKIFQMGTIDNYGSIVGLGSTGNTSEGVNIGGGSVVNRQSAVISGANNGIVGDDGMGGDAYAALSISNMGAIRGLDGVGIRYVNSGADPTKNLTVINRSVISGTTYAVQMGNGGDLFVAAGRVEGIVDAEGGYDTLQIALDASPANFEMGLVGDAATYRNFERITTAARSLSLFGTSTFGGEVVMDQGHLELRNAVLTNATLSISGSATTAGLLTGAGTMGALNTSGRTILSPGIVNAPTPGQNTTYGTFTVVNDAHIGGIYRVDVDTATGASDHIVVGGTTTIAADSVVQARGGPFTWGQRFTILSSDGGIDGSFSRLAVDNPGQYAGFLFVAPMLTQDENNVYLGLGRNGVAFSSYAFTLNQISVASALERIGAGGKADTSALYAAFVTQTVADRPALALAQLSGDVHATLPGVIAGENMLVNDILLSRLRQLGYQRSGASAALGFGGPAALSYADPAAPASGAFTGLKAPAAGPVYAIWAQSFGQWLDAGGDGNATPAETTVAGMLIGTDVTLANYSFGLAAGYSSASTSADPASANSETWRIAAYGATSFDALRLRAGATYGWSSIDTSRFVALTGESPRASYSGTAGNLFAEAGYGWTFGPVALEPFAAIGWTSVDLGSFFETNAPVAGLASTGTSFDTLYSTLGMRFASSIALGGGVTATPHASAGWRHAFGDVTPEAVLTFVNTGTAFGVDGLAVAEDSLVVAAGLDLAFGRGVTVGLSYEGMTGDGTSYNAGKASLAMRF